MRLRRESHPIVLATSIGLLDAYEHMAVVISKLPIFEASPGVVIGHACRHLSTMLAEKIDPGTCS
jgi:hypothetical protein